MATAGMMFDLLLADHEPGVLPIEVQPFEVDNLAREPDAGVPRQGSDQTAAVVGASGDHPLDILGRWVEYLSAIFYLNNALLIDRRSRLRHQMSDFLKRFHRQTSELLGFEGSGNRLFKNFFKLCDDPRFHWISLGFRLVTIRTASGLTVDSPDRLWTYMCHE